MVRLLRNRLSLTDLHQALSRDRVDPDREALHRRRDAALGHHAPGEPASPPIRAGARCRTGRARIRYRLSAQGPDVFGVDPRYARAKAEHDALMVSAPLVAAMHDRFPEAIEEEVELLDLDLAGYVLEWHARVPDWRDYYLGLDQTRHYAYLKKVLQALTFLRGPRTWVLKSPQHCEQLGPLMATFPDATVAFTHRDPVAVIQSAITMMAYSDRLRRTQHRPGLAAGLLERPRAPTAQRLRARPRSGAGRTQHRHQLPPPERQRNAVCSTSFYRRGGVELTPKVRRRFQSYLDGNPRGKHGRIRYDLQRHFGVSADELRARFDFYFDRFDVRPEDRSDEESHHER